MNYLATCTRVPQATCTCMLFASYYTHAHVCNVKVTGYWDGTRQLFAVIIMPRAELPRYTVIMLSVRPSVTSISCHLLKTKH